MDLFQMDLKPRTLSIEGHPLQEIMQFVIVLP